MSSEVPAGRPVGAPQIPGYAVEGVLGRGTSGVVYRARQVSVDRPVALKVMHADMLANARSVKRLQREARIAAALAHPNLISAIDMGQSGGNWWFAMELVEGPSLAERLEKGGRLKESDALVLFTQLCDALQHASEKGVVHRDVKPANILLERPDHPRLADLGLARIEDDPMLTRTGATLGTPHYVSPEQARDPALADVRSDIWSLGATLYHAVCGQPPFAGESTAEILSSVLYGTIPDPGELRPELSKGLVLVLRKCLSRDPNRRYFAPAELKEDLELVQAHKLPQIRPGALEPLDPTRRESRNQSLLVATIAVLLCVGIFALWRTWEGGGGAQPMDPTVEGRGPWPELVRLREDHDAGRLSLAAALGELQQLASRVPAEERAELQSTRADLRRELRQRVLAFRQDVEARLDAHLDAREFTAAEALLGADLASGLIEETGFGPDVLPEEHRGAFESRVGVWRRRLDDRRAQALTGAVIRIEGYARNNFLPGVERRRARGQWSAARRELATDLRSLCEASDCDLRGLTEEELGAALRDVQGELAVARQELERRWRELDGRVLTGEVERLVLVAREQLGRGGGAAAVEGFEDAFEGLLESHELSLAELMRAPEQRSYETFQAAKLELQDLADELAQGTALARLEELDREARPLYVARDYAGAVAFWSEHGSEPALAAAGDTVAVRLEEARELVAFLRRAAAGVARLAGERVSIRQGSIAVSGRIELDGEPLERGFRLRTSGGNPLAYVLRPTTEVTGEVLDASALERFATEGADLEADLGLQLQRALFRFQEGDLEGAEQLLGGAALEGGDLILYDLGLRVARQLGKAQDVEARRRERARGEFERLLGADAAALDPDQRAVEIGRLLREYGDVLSESASQALRRTRATLERDLPPSTLSDFVAAYGIEGVEFPRFGRVGLRFGFDARDVGTWERGEWLFDGSGWTGPASQDMAQLLERATPTLELVDPLLVDSGTLEVRLRLFQPKDSPPDLLLVSVLGFHVAFTGQRGSAPARVHADTTDLATVCREALEGQGEVIAGLAADAQHEIHLSLSRGSGRLVVSIDGQRVGGRSAYSPPKGEGARLTVRSIEPLELREVRIEGPRR